MLSPSSGSIHAAFHPASSSISSTGLGSSSTATSAASGSEASRPFANGSSVEAGNAAIAHPHNSSEESGSPSVSFTARIALDCSCCDHAKDCHRVSPFAAVLLRYQTAVMFSPTGASSRNATNDSTFPSSSVGMSVQRCPVSPNMMRTPETVRSDACVDVVAIPIANPTASVISVKVRDRAR